MTEDRPSAPGAGSEPQHSEPEAAGLEKQDGLGLRLMALDRKLGEIRGRGKPSDTTMGEEPGEKRRRVYGDRYEYISCSRDRNIGQLGVYVRNNLASKFAAQ
jgi:hypothetical protein